MLISYGNENIGKLIIFEEFEVDKNLKPTPQANNPTFNQFGIQDEQFDSGSFITVGPRKSAARRSKELHLLFEVYSFKWFLAKAVSVVFGLIERVANNKDPQEVFLKIKASTAEVDIFEKRTSKLKESLDFAKSSGQKVLAERLQKEIELSTLESLLFLKGFGRYITEGQLLTFSAKTKRGLRLIWIKDFVRVIPKEVTDKKTLADSLMVFDNYVVLHYDPSKSAEEYDKEEKKRREAQIRDPILFGVIEGSRKLYFIGDWIDEKCDLTLDQVIKTIGEEAKEL